MAEVKDLNYYMTLPYTTRVVRYDSGDAPPYMAHVQELPGCDAQGASEAEALEELEDAMRLFIETMIADGVKIPEPKEVPKPMKEYKLTRYERYERSERPIGSQVVFAP